MLSSAFHGAWLRPRPFSTRLIEEARAVLELAIPIMGIALVNMGMSVTDAVMVSRLFGAEAFAAVAVGSDLYSLLYYLGAGVIAGVSPFYTAAATRGDARAMLRLERIGWLLVVLCAAVAVPAAWTAPDWLDALGLDPHLLAEGRGYARAMALALVPMLGVVLLRTLLTAMGRPRLFFKVTLAMLPLNAALNWVLMVGPGPVPAFGPAGAGVASLVVATASLALLLAVARKDRHRAPSAPDWRELGAVLRVGLPIGVATIAEVGLWLGATLYAARLGSAEVAAHTLALRTAGVAYAVPAALLQAAMVRVARAEALGVGVRPVTAASLGLALTFGSILAALIAFAGAPLAHGFFGDDAVDARAGILAAGLLLILGTSHVVLGPGSAAAGLLRGRKDARGAMVHVLIGHWIIGVPVSVWLCEAGGLGVTGLWLGLALGTVTTATLGVGRVLRDL